MAVSVDTVYQRVLAFANKEQRGYITPQDFNLFACQVQQEILEQYFYDINQWNRQQGNTTEHSDMLLEINEKVAIFKATTSPLFNAGTQIATLPNTLYKIGTLSHTRFGDGIGRVTFEELNYDEHQIRLASPLTAPTLKRPYFINQNGGLLLFAGSNLAANEVGLSFVRRPHCPNWAYVVINGKTLYNDNVSTDFELHSSEESELVYRILAYAGISIQKPELTQVASQALGSQIQQEKQ
jgi:hypothetical protein